jgi:hypothetical protein
VLIVLAIDGMSTGKLAMVKCVDWDQWRWYEFSGLMCVCVVSGGMRSRIGRKS